MKVRLPLMVQDRLEGRSKRIPELVDHITIDDEPFFLDGPVTERVAVLDFDEETGALLDGAKFITVEGEEGIDGRYDILEPQFHDEITREFNQVSVLATVLDTMKTIEGERALGRKLQWAFGQPQLLIVPRAGEWANAFYERETHSLQFFYVTKAGRDTVYTSLSRDIVAHEAAHAILDGILPDLYDAITPQSLALHEAFADLTAVIMAVRSRELSEAVLEQTGGELEHVNTAFNRIAGEFGESLHGGGSLRNLGRITRLDEINSVEPHELSMVLSSALYSAFTGIYEERRRTLRAENYSDPLLTLAGEALYKSVQQFARMIFRALDYLPPGEISFADYARAILAADRVAFDQANDPYRAQFEAAFVDSRIVDDVDALAVKTNFYHEIDRSLDMGAIIESDFIAYKFANQNRDLLNIPSSVDAFYVYPRLISHTRRGEKKSDCRDIVFRVSWDQIEDNNVAAMLPNKRRVTVGTTLIISADGASAVTDGSTTARGGDDGFIELTGSGAEREPELIQSAQSKYVPFEYVQNIEKNLFLDEETVGTKEIFIRARLTSDMSAQQQQSRDAMLEHLMDQGVLEMNEKAIGPDGALRSTVIRARTSDEDAVVKVQGTARMLHIAADMLQSRLASEETA